MRNYAPWVLIVTYSGGLTYYYGEFASKARAEEYALSLDSNRPHSTKIEPMIAPRNNGERD